MAITEFINSTWAAALALVGQIPPYDLVGLLVAVIVGSLSFQCGARMVDWLRDERG